MKVKSPRVRSLDIGIAPTAYVKGDLDPQIKLWSSTFHVGYSFARAQRVNGHLHFFAGTVSGQNPDVQYSDKTGSASVDFFNSDGTGNYRVVIEGMDLEGHIGRKVIRYQVKAK